jgi:hypothetical protein
MKVAYCWTVLRNHLSASDGSGAASFIDAVRLLNFCFVVVALSTIDFAPE